MNIIQEKLEKVADAAYQSAVEAGMEKVAVSYGATQRALINRIAKARALGSIKPTNSRNAILRDDFNNLVSKANGHYYSNMDITNPRYRKSIHNVMDIVRPLKGEKNVMSRDMGNVFTKIRGKTQGMPMTPPTQEIINKILADGRSIKSNMLP
jgi:hypothetical protein